VYGLTTGQYTPTSPLGFRGKSTPAGTVEFPFNPIELMLASGATYVARGYTRKMDQLKHLVAGGIAHRGFSFIDVLQICATFFPATDYYNPRVYEMPGQDLGNFEAACIKAKEWDYSSDTKIGLGVFYTRSFPSFERQVPAPVRTSADRENAITGFLAARK
ncbi:MAG TPA: thiamine pyrophosphate-dependent enzyme, partial [Methanoregula sp.]|nr:thiamine pyrophosphate-dependent enzyme [Methanoregula sp.]